MSDPRNPGGSAADLSPDERMAGLFAQLVMQQSNMALMLLGKVAHPESGEVVRNLEAARLFIDQLEMIEAKTKGNLNKDESNLLRQSLMSLRLAFVEAAAEPEPRPQKPAPETPAASPDSAPPPPAAEDEHHKKFSKKY